MQERIDSSVIVANGRIVMRRLQGHEKVAEHDGVGCGSTGWFTVLIPWSRAALCSRWPAAKSSTVSAISPSKSRFIGVGARSKPAGPMGAQRALLRGHGNALWRDPAVALPGGDHRRGSVDCAQRTACCSCGGPCIGRVSRDRAWGRRRADPRGSGSRSLCSWRIMGPTDTRRIA